MPPTHSYIIRGTVFSTIVNGRSEVRVTIGSGPGTSQNIYIGGSTHLEKGLTLFIKNLDTGELYPQTVTTSSTTGNYIFDCKNFVTAWAEDQIIQIIASNVIDTLHDDEEGDDQKEHERINARRRIMVDRDGNEIDSDNPLPVMLSPSDDLNFANAKLIITRGANRRISQKDWYYKGRHWRQTIEYGTNTDTHNAIIEVT